MDSRISLGLFVTFCAILALTAGIFLAGCDPAATPPALSPPSAYRPEDVAKAAEAQAPKPPETKAQEPAQPPPVPATQAQEPPVDEQTFKPDPRLVVSPVDEPEMPLDPKEGEKYGYIPLRNGGGFVFERAGADGKIVSGVVIPGVILCTRGFVELFGCGDGGKTHETVVRLDCDILGLDTAFTLAGFKRGRLPEKLGINDPQQGSRLIAVVQWLDEQNKVVSHRSEDLVISDRRARTMPRIGWTYVGHWIEVADPSSEDPLRKHKILGAGQSRSLVTTFRDTTALLDCPLEEAVDDTSFLANYMLLPKRGTPVRVIFRHATEAERGEIARIEKEVAAEEPPQKPHHDHKDEKK